MIKGDPIILTNDNDSLGHLNKTQFIKGFIEDLNNEGFWDNETADRLIALYGNWGTGKSSIMKTLSSDFDTIGAENQNCLNPSEFKTIFFEAWRYEQDPNLALSLLHHICNELEIDLEDKIKQSNGEKMMNVFVSLAGGACVNGDIDLKIPRIGSIKQSLSWDAEKSIKKYKELQNEFIKQTILDKKSYHQDQNKIKQGFKIIFDNENILENKKIIIFVDDLDRCEPENITNLLAAIKLFFTLSDKLIFVVGIDKDAVTKALQIKYQSTIKAEEYLEKIFMISFSTTPTRYNIRQRLDKEKYGINDLEELERMFNVIGFNNPRHVKKLLNKMNLLYGEIINNPLIDYDSGQTGKLLLFSVLAILHEFYGEIREQDINIELTNKKNSYRTIKQQQNIDAAGNKQAIGINIDNFISESEKGIMYFLPVNQTITDNRYHVSPNISGIMGHTNNNFTKKEILIQIINFIQENGHTKSLLEEGNNTIGNIISFINKYF